MKARLRVALPLLAAFFAYGLAASVQAAPKGSNSNLGDIKDCVVITSPGTYNVTVDLPSTGGLLPGGDCIEIAASSVSLNLNDHSIIGSGTGAAITDGGSDLNNIQIRQGTISGFVTAIDLINSVGSSVEYVHASGNLADGIALGEKGVARYNVALENDRGLVMTCPANAIGNSAWGNVTNDLYLIDEPLCSLSDGLNSFGSSDGSNVSCASVGLVDCNGSCVNLATDEANCGGCDQSCLPGQLCSGGACAASCQSGLTNCNGTCVNNMTDEANCGACDQSCPLGQLCIGGVCAVSCQSGLTKCNDTCVNNMTDEANCGACNNICQDGAFCNGGSCELPPDCSNGVVDDGEVCDDGNNLDGDGCSANCQSDETCGNHIIDHVKGEECDDGNNTDNDGCSAICTIEGCVPSSTQVCVRENGYGSCIGIEVCDGERGWGLCSANTPEGEICDGVDNDCDGEIDEDYVDLGEYCTVGIGTCQRSGTLVCAGSGTQCSASAGAPTEEICDGQDNDCDGQIDEELPLVTCVLQTGVCSNSVKQCGGLAGYFDCGRAEYGPDYEITELSCDDKDNDCDGQTDENFGLGESCGFGACKGGYVTCSNDGGVECSTQSLANPEVCDGQDNDCDGIIDEGC